MSDSGIQPDAPPPYSYGETPGPPAGFLRSLLDLLSGEEADRIRESRSPYGFSPFSGVPMELSWEIARPGDLPLQPGEPWVEPHLRAALLRLNPRIAAQPERVDDVIGHLRTALHLAADDGLLSANEEWTGWLLGQRYMPYGFQKHTLPIRLLDFARPENNRFVVTTSLAMDGCPNSFDLVCFVNGIPLVVGAVPAPTRPAVTWMDGAVRLLNDQAKCPAFFVPNLFMVATEGKTLRYGTLGEDARAWRPWRVKRDNAGGSEAEAAAMSLLNPETLLDLLRHFTGFLSAGTKPVRKLIARPEEYEAAHRIAHRAAAGEGGAGVVWNAAPGATWRIPAFAAKKWMNGTNAPNAKTLFIGEAFASSSHASFLKPLTVKRVHTGEELAAQLATSDLNALIVAPGLVDEVEADLSLESILAFVEDEGDSGKRLSEAVQRVWPRSYVCALTRFPLAPAHRTEVEYLSRYTFEEALEDNAVVPVYYEQRLLQDSQDSAEEKETTSSQPARVRESVATRIGSERDERESLRPESIDVAHLTAPLPSRELVQLLATLGTPEPEKTHGLLIDDIGVLDSPDLRQSLEARGLASLFRPLDSLLLDLEIGVRNCFHHLRQPSPDEAGMLNVQDVLQNPVSQDAFAADFSALMTLWETLSPHPALERWTDDYRRLARTYESLRPPDGIGVMVWRPLGAATLRIME